MDGKKLVQEVLNKTQVVPTKYKIAGIGLIILFLIAIFTAGYLYFMHSKSAEEQAQQAKVLSQQYSSDINALQNELKISKQNAELLAEAVQKVQTGKTQAVTYVTVQSPTVEQAANDVADRINRKDVTLPPVVLENTDRTFVVPQEVKQADKMKDWQVGVYKVNNYRNWEWSTGYGQHGGDRYIPIELQRNFSKDRSVSYEQHLGGKEKGWEAKYTMKTDKIFGVF